MTFALLGRIVATGMLIWALDDHPYGYFTLLRFVVCIVTAYCAVLSNEKGKVTWTWILGGMAVLFNPIVPIHIDRESWQVIDAVAAVVLLISLVPVRGRLSNKNYNNDSVTSYEDEDEE